MFKNVKESDVYWKFLLLQKKAYKGKQKSFIFTVFIVEKKNVLSVTIFCSITEKNPMNSVITMSIILVSSNKTYKGN